jgi:thiol-disulfide isomerase/thioredoxin
MQFENSLWRKFVCAALFASALLAVGCDKPASNSPAPAPVTPSAATSNQPVNQAVPATSPVAAPSVVLATPAPAQPVATALPGPTPIPLEGKDFEVSMLNGPKMKLSKVLGRKKIVVVNFWATWCGPCRKEIPDLIALANNNQGKDVEILGLTVEDPAQAMTAVKDYTKQSQINYKVGFAPMPMFMLFNGARPGGPIPQTFIFGKDGKLLYHIPGLRPAFKDYVQQAIDLALKS